MGWICDLPSRKDSFRIRLMSGHKWNMSDGIRAARMCEQLGLLLFELINPPNTHSCLLQLYLSSMLIRCVRQYGSCSFQIVKCLSLILPEINPNLARDAHAETNSMFLSWEDKKKAAFYHRLVKGRRRGRSWAGDEYGYWCAPDRFLLWTSYSLHLRRGHYRCKSQSQRCFMTPVLVFQDSLGKCPVEDLQIKTESEGWADR